jgi:hypothetical protein
VKFYQQAGQTILQNPSPEYKIILKGKEGDRRYAAPTTDEVAVLMVGSGTEENASKRNIILAQKGSNKLSYITEHHSSYDPLQYVIMFPRGEQGWQHHTYPITDSNKFITAMKYYSYRIQDRLTNMSPTPILGISNIFKN